MQNYYLTNAIKHLLCLSVLLTIPLMAQNTKMKGFANVDFIGNKDGKSNFSLGQYDNFITSSLTDRISFLGETVFESEGGEYYVDIERVIIKYEVNNWLEIKSGKFHNPLGYWNNAYHHGTLLQPTIQRPIAVRFEDEDGILPIHSTGLWLSGHDIGNIKFGYDFVISNGIGKNNTMADDNNNKAITLGMHIKPADKLEIGLSGYFDRLNKGDINVHLGDSLASAISITQGCFHIAYLGSKYEFIAENHFIQHDYGWPVKKKAISNGLFAYFGYRLKNFTPYVLYDNLSYGVNDIYYRGNNIKKYTIGIKYAFSYLANLKLELSRQDVSANAPLYSGMLSFAIGF